MLFPRLGAQKTISKSISMQSYIKFLLAFLAASIIFALFPFDNALHSNGILAPAGKSSRKSIPTKSQLSTSYLLWSKTPHLVNWSTSEELCDEILTSDNLTTPIFGQDRNWTIPDAHTDQSMANLLSNCSKFREFVPFATEPASQAEAEYPLAYVFVGARNAAQAIRFLRMIYQPQNAYCLTYDLKSSKEFQETITGFAKCFKNEKNVFLTPSPETIKYADFSLLHSVMVCMKVLLEKWPNIQWKYVQVVSWNDFPLRTNEEMVKIFKIFNGSQDCEMASIPRRQMYLRRFSNGQPRQVAPSGLRLYKGSFATSMTKDFIDFLFTDPTSVRLFEWFKEYECPEEYYWQTIIFNTHLKAPGSFPGHCLDVYEARVYQERDEPRWKAYASRYQIWDTQTHRVCHSRKFTSHSCVYGVEDVPTLITTPELIAHKIYEEFEPLGAFCLERWFWNRVSGRHNYSFSISEKYYADFSSVRYHNMENKDDFVC